MKWKQWVILSLLLILIVGACSGLRSNSQSKDGVSSVANVTPEVLFEQGKSYQVKPLNECDTTLQLFDFERDAKTGEIIGQSTVPPELFCKLDKPFTVVDKSSGLVPETGWRRVMGELKYLRFVRIRWETDLSGFYQEAFVEELRAYKDSNPVKEE